VLFPLISVASTTGSARYTLPDFPAIGDDSYLTAFRVTMVEERAGLDALLSHPAGAQTIRDWELAGLGLATVANTFWTRKDADTTDRLDEIEALISPELAAHADSILMDRRLYDHLLMLDNLAGSGEVALDAQDRWWLAEKLREYRRSGIDLDDTGQARLKEINEAISSLETEYSSLVVKGRNAAALHLTNTDDVRGLDETALEAARSAAQARGLEGWVIEVVNTTRQPLIASLDNRDTRQRLFEASVGRGQGEFDTRETIIELARLRAEKAELLGYEHFAAYVADDGCAKTTDAVMNLLTRAADAGFANARREAETLQADLSELDPGATLESWDWAWLAEKKRKTQWNLDQGEVSAYLDFETVLCDGVFAAATRLYGVTFVARDDVAGYSPDCRAYEVIDCDGSGLGLLLIDPYARPTKQGGAWMTSPTDQADLTGERPVATNNCNQTKPETGKPTLMTWDQVTTLFHEFGHDLHALFAASRYPSLSGTNTPRDFVEFPSQVNEMWAWEPTVIAGFARHWSTGEPMPDTLRDTILASRHFGEGYDAAESYAAMLLDQAWHSTSLENLPATVDEVEPFETAVLARFGALEVVPPRYRSAYFSHIWGPGYAAGYYGYMWAEVMDADTVAWFEENGGLTRENGDRFRREVLAVGGSEDVMEAYRRFRGAEPDPVHLFRRRGLV
jgi:peptidyl-dipeptidase Dcp